MEKNNSADSWFYFKPMVGGRITSGSRKHKLFNEVRLVIGDFELPLQFKKIEATNLVKRTIICFPVSCECCVILLSHIKKYIEYQNNIFSLISIIFSVFIIILSVSVALSPTGNV